MESYLRVQITVNNRHVPFVLFGDNAKSSIEDSIEHLIMQMQNMPLNFEFDTVDNELAVMPPGPMNPNFIHQIVEGGPHMIHPLQPGVLFFDGPVVVTFQEVFVAD